ncbi:hypothetical protein IWQ60_003784 [Tieghemiomyces parasiticus]|uniref:FAD/NAD(P)-binding domain-containing protein n=1 Tax=Tieghemiomyces parasiticus TaxID=78921 RepID=A0A9W8ACK6_9FUNG|nr:hypothetical protein IWQ60_003784 [Tieghemiomyces parasiticus]
MLSRTFTSPLTAGPRAHLRSPVATRRLLHALAPRVVVLGSGWAGFEILRDLDKRRYDVTVVSPRNYFVFTPLLASTSVGTLEFRCITEPVRSRGDNFKFYEATADRIDLDNRAVLCSSTVEGVPGQFAIPYDKLVVTVGARSNTFDIPGVREHAFFLKDVPDARRIRQRVLDCFEWASQPNVSPAEQSRILHFAVVGGGPTGVEFAAELSDFVRDDLRRVYPHLMDRVTLTVYDVAPTLLGTFDRNLAAYADARFRRQGIRVRTRTAIAGVTARELILADQRREPYGLLVWATGLTATPLVTSLGDRAAHDPRSGRILCDDRLRVLGPDRRTPLPDVFALGDCATLANHGLPATAQVAKQQGIYLSRVLNRLGRATDWTVDDEQPFTYRHLGSMAYLGGWKAIVDLQKPGAPASAPKRTAGGNGLRLADYIGEGRLAWLFWRTSYFTMSVSPKNKILIPVYWFLTWVFGRDISRF